MSPNNSLNPFVVACAAEVYCFARRYLTPIFVRINGKPWDKTPPASRLPDEVIAKTAAKYQ